MQIFGVLVNDATVQVVAAEVVKVTPQFFVREEWGWRDERRAAFPFSKRVEKKCAHLTPRAALEHYMAKRQRDKSNAQSVVGLATRQIASANELLMREPPPAVDAVDPHVTDTGTPTTRED